MKKLKFLFIIFIVLILFGTGYFVVFMHQYGNQPITDIANLTLIDIHTGQGLKLITETLHEQHIIQHPILFMLIARIYGYDKRIKAGEYAIKPQMTPVEILQMFVSGKVHHYKITIPEGYTVRQIASLFASTGIVSEESFLSIINDKEFITQLGIPSDSLEGYLFPDTYYVTKSNTAKQIVAMMVDRFKDIWTDEWNTQAQNLGFSRHEIITLASIIEKETGITSERPLISSVFHNRLKRGMRLDSDPTVIYGIENFNGNLTRKDLNTVTSYNTYHIRGLPPGPIANPGKESIQAALFPAETGYLFFVSKGDSTHEFTSNINDHNRAVRRYQKK